MEVFTFTVNREELKMIGDNLLSYAHWLHREKDEYFCDNKAMKLYQKLCDQTYCQRLNVNDDVPFPD